MAKRQAPAGGNALTFAYRWLDERLGIGMVVRATLLHPVPRTVNWWYVLGSAVLTTFLIQVVTGIFLAFTYAPTPDHAYASLDYITHQQLLGNVLRGIHYWGASAMVTLIFAHMAAHFLTGSYKYPRELQWVTGVFLLFATLVMAFTGQVLRWNQDAYWGLSVAIAQAARTPLIGPLAAQLFAAGPEINGQTLTHIYIIHMLLIPGGIFALIGVHLYLVIYKGISEWPVPNKPVDPRTYWAEYEEILHTDGEPFFPPPYSKTRSWPSWLSWLSRGWPSPSVARCWGCAPTRQCLLIQSRTGSSSGTLPFWRRSLQQAPTPSSSSPRSSLSSSFYPSLCSMRESDTTGAGPGP